MTDLDEGRPLSRREIRLREMAAAGVVPDATPAPQEAAVAAKPVSSELSNEIDIPLFDENGRHRSRRELRELRDQAIAEQAEAAPAETVLPETVAFDVIADQEAASDFDALLQQGVADVAAEEAAAEVAEAEETEAEVDAEPAVDSQASVEPEAEQAPTDDAELEEVVEAEAEAELHLEAEAEVESEAEAGTEPEAEVESAEVAPVAAVKSQGYSFPDIAPLDEGHSIFDDPALRVMNAQAEPSVAEADGGRDFDDLITRAVAQEGAASTTNTSALILPTMPEAEGLSGPLGETGELFVTGSFELPKSLSETGGHAALHDSVEADPLDELGFVEATPTGMMAPVSASRAISARSEQGPLVTEAAKDKSKMPVVLIATGGVLVLGAAGLIVWAAASGLFG